MAGFTIAEWEKINALFAQDPYKYGLPKREYDSVVLASFNICKLGAKHNRTEAAWRFLAQICQHFDLLSVQETMDDLEGFDYLQGLMGGNYGAIVSDVTGGPASGERLGFLYQRSRIERGSVVFLLDDRTTLFRTMGRATAVASQFPEGVIASDGNLLAVQPPLTKFLTFVRQPYCASFRIRGHRETQPYAIMAVNAHLYSRNDLPQQHEEFDALMDWIMTSVKQSAHDNYVVMADLNGVGRDRGDLEAQIQTFSHQLKGSANVHFPFLEVHPQFKTPFQTNARLDSTFDQIGMFSRDERLHAPGNPACGPDYGVVNFVELFREALELPPIEMLTLDQQQDFFSKVEEVSDHLPLWVRLPLP